jgi:hypothetical protein
MASPAVHGCEAVALIEHAAYLDLLREIGKHGAAASHALAAAHTASTANQRRAALTALAEPIAHAAAVVNQALTAPGRGMTP